MSIDNLNIYTFESKFAKQQIGNRIPPNNGGAIGLSDDDIPKLGDTIASLSEKQAQELKEYLKKKGINF